jgi:nucleoside diphosphate kinase
MNTSLSYVWVTPYTVAKSRTGGVLARLLSRTNLELVGAQMVAPDSAFAKEYADNLRKRSPQNQIMLIPNYVERHFISSSGHPLRSLLLLFQGENPCEQLLATCGHIYSSNHGMDTFPGETIRDTYGDLVFESDDPEKVTYFEPAVLTPRNQEEANEDLRLMAKYFSGKENILKDIAHHPDQENIEQTLVIIKPDNWVEHTARPGTIIDIFSRTGLKIIGAKIHHFSLDQAMHFYGPVKDALQRKLAPKFGKKAKDLLEKEFGILLGEESLQSLTASVGTAFAHSEFDKLVQFMCGKKPSDCPSPAEAGKPGDVKCMILVYEGENAISKIRDALGATNPDEASEGTVRREFGSSVMINTAHASDSPASYDAERGIVKTEENSLWMIIKECLG